MVGNEEILVLFGKWVACGHASEELVAMRIGHPCIVAAGDLQFRVTEIVRPRQFFGDAAAENGAEGGQGVTHRVWIDMRDTQRSRTNRKGAPDAILGRPGAEWATVGLRQEPRHLQHFVWRKQRIIVQATEPPQFNYPFDHRSAEELRDRKPLRDLALAVLDAHLLAILHDPAT